MLQNEPGVTCTAPGTQDDDNEDDEVTLKDDSDGFSSPEMYVTLTLEHESSQGFLSGLLQC